MKNRDCNTRNHRHGGFSKNPSSCNFRTRVIPYYSIFGIHGMSKILDSGCSTKKKSRAKKTPPNFSRKNRVFDLYYAKKEKICLKTEPKYITYNVFKKFGHNVFSKKSFFAW